MPLDTTSNTNETAVERLPQHGDLDIGETQSHDYPSEGAGSTTTSLDHVFDESRCLFCNTLSSDLEANIHHMLRHHGFQFDSAHLVVDMATFLEYLHLIISEYCECLYCGTQRNTHQAVQQHMTAKGHCMLDLTNQESELREFYEWPSSVTSRDPRVRLATRLESDFTRRSRRRKMQPFKSNNVRLPGHRHDRLVNPHSSATLSARAATLDNEHPPRQALPPQDLVGLSARRSKREHTFRTELSRKSAGDRRSLMHLPSSQQRALLTTQHKQLEKAQRTEHSRRTRLEGAGNMFGRLGTVRLVRQPPHFGNVSGLNR